MQLRLYIDFIRMDFKVAAAALVLSLLCSWNTISLSIENDTRNHLVYYVLTDQTFANASSPCGEYEHKKLFNCSLTNIIELFYHLKAGFTSGDDVKVVFLPGVHFMNNTRNQQVSTQSYFKLTMIGIGNVEIICINQLDFLMQNIQCISVSNLHFKNCIGRSSKSSSLLTFNISIGLYGNTSVALDNLHINSENVTGIKINLHRNKHVDYSNSQLTINITNSIVSTKGNDGILMLHPQEPYKVHYSYTIYVFLSMNIVNVSFINSCFSLELNGDERSIYHNIRYANPITFLNTKFTGNKCSRVLEFSQYYGDVDVILNNVSIYNTQSRTLIYSCGNYNRYYVHR